MTRLRVVFLGLDTLYARNALRAIAVGHDVLAVYSDIPRRARRSLVDRVKERSIRLARASLPILESLPRLSDALGAPYSLARDLADERVLSEMRSLSPDLICIAGLNRLLQQSVLAIPRLGTINAHASLLPDYRGPNTFFWMAKLNARLGGVTLHWAEQGADDGAILEQRPLNLYSGLREADYYKALSVLGAEAFQSTLARIASGERPTGQVNGESSTPFCRNPKPEDLILEGCPTVEHAIWFYEVASRYGRPRLAADGAPLRRMAPVPFAGARRVVLANGDVWCA
jgi:methionyl-tRNA formyltransferase